MTGRSGSIFLLIVVLAGCGARMSQIDTVRRLLPDGTDPRLAEYAWSLEFNGAAYVIYPIEANGRRVLFADGNGLRLTWDGVSLILLEGVPGAFGRYESGVEPDGRERWYAQAGYSVERAVCTPQRQWRLTQDRFGWRQECVSTMGQKSLLSHHLVEFDANGNIKLVEASIRPGASTFRLSRHR